MTKIGQPPIETRYAPSTIASRLVAAARRTSAGASQRIAVARGGPRRSAPSAPRS
jgi:hypothetical protein